MGLIGHRQAIGHAFHITSDEKLTWNQIHQNIAEAVGTDANIVHIPADLLAQYDQNLLGELTGDKSASVVFDNSKVKQFVPGFTATIPFSERIIRTLDWFHRDPSRQIVKEETNEWIDMVIERYVKAFPDNK